MSKNENKTQSINDDPFYTPSKIANQDSFFEKMMQQTKNISAGVFWLILIVSATIFVGGGLLGLLIQGWRILSSL